MKLFVTHYKQLDDKNNGRKKLSILYIKVPYELLPTFSCSISIKCS